MAFNHHHHQPHLHQNPPPPCCSSSCCFNSSCGYGCSSVQSQHHSPLPPSDPLLQAIASQLLQSNPTHSYAKLYTQKLQPHNQFQHLKQQLHQQEPSPPPQQQQAHSIISSLLCRIEALEASLRQFSSYRSRSSYSHSLRDSAARVIQTHFRAFLVRRSRTLGQLKDLALIKSAFNSLKSLLSNDTHFDFRALSRNAMDLLLKLDSIQGSDRMVRDGKKSISRDLVRFLELMDGVATKRNGLSIKAMKNDRFGRNGDKSRPLLGSKFGNLDVDRRTIIGKLRDRVEKIRGFARVSDNDEEHVELEGFQHFSNDDEEEEYPRVVINGKNGRIRNGVLVKRHGVQSRVKKSVSFAEEDGNVFKVSNNTHESFSNGDGTCLDDSGSSDDHEELVEKICSEVEEMKSLSQGTEDDEEEHMEPNEEERIARATSIERRETRGNFQDSNRDFVFSAPLPVHMEAKADLVRGRIQRNNNF
ncbi:hypothetical protein FNV43_RR14531 [Rhamnella rubrinervis]|uniref:BAG family molecular chaperone regulator 8, chloroplastic n=1 Tax=Rhamnella rubrinervis TaxID=2594499 RepID=A0A8K0H3H1_9ROSA|nr:hypothetical protein FNV43_RR14531 [Rhamnella rubrinervis]